MLKDVGKSMKATDDEDGQKRASPVKACLKLQDMLIPEFNLSIPE
jgi:hypothetical protein